MTLAKKMPADTSEYLVLSFGSAKRAKFEWLFGKLPIPRWSGLAALGESKLLKRVWIWAVITPILARVLSQLPEEITVEFFDSELNFQLALPFSWVVFYFAAVCISIGGAIYRVRVPLLLSEFPDWGTVTDKAARMQVAQGFAQLTSRPVFFVSDTEYMDSEEVVAEVWNYYDGAEKLYELNQAALTDLNSGTERLRTLLTSKERVVALLSSGRIHADIARRWSRLACVAFYGLGIIGTLAVLSQSLIWVVSTLGR